MNAPRTAPSAELIEELARLCRNGRDGVPRNVEPTGSAELDAVLPGGGWQSGTIVELMPECMGIGELRLLMPVLARITNGSNRANGKGAHDKGPGGERHVALIEPPCIPFAPALLQHGIRLERFWIIRAQAATDILWAAEQTLRCKSFGAVLAWPQAIKDRDTRRLQLAAESGSSIGFLYRAPTAALQASPAAVRLRLRPDQEGQLQLDVIKCRGTRAGMTVKHEGTGD